MPIPGQGAVPTGSLYNELTAVNRRAFVPRTFVQIYYATPTLFHTIGAAQKSAGGLSQITIPVQGQSMVQGQFTGYGGGFNAPMATPALSNAQFATAYWVVPVMLPFGESVIQATDREVSLLEARMNDVWSVSVQNMGGLLFTNNSNDSLLPNSLYDACDDATNVTTYGGINRSSPGNSFWKGQYYNASALTSGFTRKTMSQYIMRITDASGGESPTYGVMNPADFSKLNEDFIGAETIFTRPGTEFGMATALRSSFPNLNVAGIPIYADHFCPVGNAYFINSKYTSMYLDENALFEFSGFYSLVPLGQIGQQGVMVTGYNVVTSKPKANAHITGFGGAAW